MWRSCALLVFSLSMASLSSAGEQAVSLTVAPGSEIMTTVAVTSAFGNDADGPKPVVLTGNASALLRTHLDPVHGSVAHWLQFTATDVDFVDTDFNLTVVVPIVISLVGVGGELNSAPLSPGIAVAAHTSEFDAAPLDLTWNEGELVVLDPPGVPAAGTVFDIAGTAEVVTTPNGGMLDVTVTVPILDFDEVTESGITVTTTLAGDIVFTGSFPAPDVPALGPSARFGLAVGVLTLGLGMLHRTSRARRRD